MLQKPRRGWWVAPGGKMESEESVKESMKREYFEETGITIKDPEIAGVFTIVMMDYDEVISEWMMFTFKATVHEGKSIVDSPEGKLQWIPKGKISGLPMAEGDKFIFEHVLQHDFPLYGTFYYSPDFKLLSYRLDSKAGFINGKVEGE